MTKPKWGRSKAEEPLKETAMAEEEPREEEPAPEEEPEKEPEEKEPESRGDAEARIIAEWKRGEAELKELVPDFSLIEAMKNEVFAEAITRGSSVAQAYLMMTHADEKKPASYRREIPQNAQSANKGTGKSRVDPSTMSREEFRQYINNIKNV